MCQLACEKKFTCKSQTKKKKNVDMGKRDLGALINLCYFIFSNIAKEERRRIKDVSRLEIFRLIANWKRCESFSHQPMIAFLGRKLNYSTRSIIFFWARLVEGMQRWNAVNNNDLRRKKTWVNCGVDENLKEGISAYRKVKNLWKFKKTWENFEKIKFFFHLI